MKKIRTFSAATAMILVAMTYSCSREKELVFNDWDTDSNNLIDRGEFKNVFTSNYYEDWNMEDDEYLDDEDFLTAVYRVWDEDGDELLTEEEWIVGFDYFYGDYIIDDFDAIDVDGDGELEYVEYEEVLKPTTLYMDWDLNGDGEIDEEELATGLFETWDLDNSGYIELAEYSQFDAYYLDI